MRQRRPARQRPPAGRVDDPPGRARRADRPRHRDRLRPGRPARRLRAGPHPGPGRRARRHRGHRQRTRARRRAHRPGTGTVTIRVVIADDHRVVRDGLCYLLSQEPDIEVAGEAGDGRQAVDVVTATRPDVLLLDLYMPGPDGHAVLAALHDAPRRPAVVVLTSAADDEHLVRAVQAGATSYLLKTASAEHVIAAVRDAATGTA